MMQKNIGDLYAKEVQAVEDSIVITVQRNYDEKLMAQDIVNRLKYADKLEKALDKACEVMVNRVNIDSGYGTSTLRFTKEQWKEWCMKDANR